MNSHDIRSRLLIDYIIFVRGYIVVPSVVQWYRHVSVVDIYIRPLHLPMPVSFSMEVAHEIKCWRSQADSLATRVHDAIDRFKPRQQEIYLEVQCLLESHDTLCFFIDGKAGCGKTTLMNTICDILQSQGNIILATATSAFAAQLYAGRRTHSTFKVIDIISSK
jgi:hypothetical protein